jgi:hypothetical protein
MACIGRLRLRRPTSVAQTGTSGESFFRKGVCGVDAVVGPPWNIACLPSGNGRPEGFPQLAEVRFCTSCAVSDPQQNGLVPPNSRWLRRELRETELSSRLRRRIALQIVVARHGGSCKIDTSHHDTNDAHDATRQHRDAPRIPLSRDYESVLRCDNGLVLLNRTTVECMAETLGVRCGMPCIELQELEARHEQFNKLSFCTIASLAAGKGEFSKWQRAGRARVAFSILAHQKNCPVCLSLAAEQSDESRQGSPGDGIALPG